MLTLAAQMLTLLLALSVVTTNAQLVTTFAGTGSQGKSDGTGTGTGGPTFNYNEGIVCSPNVMRPPHSHSSHTVLGAA